MRCGSSRSPPSSLYDEQPDDRPGADARAAFDKVRAETYGLEDEDCQTATPQLDRTIGRELDVVQAVYNHLQWLHAPRASRRR